MAELSPQLWEKLLRGDRKTRFPGVLVLLEKEFATTTRKGRLEQLAAFRGALICRDCEGSRLRPEALLFGESTGRVLTATADADAWLAMASRHGVPAQKVGRTGGSALTIQSAGGEIWIQSDLARLREIWATSLACQLEDPTL